VSRWTAIYFFTLFLLVRRLLTMLTQKRPFWFKKYQTFFFGWHSHQLTPSNSARVMFVVALVAVAVLSRAVADGVVVPLVALRLRHHMAQSFPRAVRPASTTGIIMHSA